MDVSFEFEMRGGRITAGTVTLRGISIPVRRDSNGRWTLLASDGTGYSPVYLEDQIRRALSLFEENVS